MDMKGENKPLACKQGTHTHVSLNGGIDPVNPSAALGAGEMTNHDCECDEV